MERIALMFEKESERDLLAECRNGNREAMQTLFVQNQKRVFSVALNFFGGNDDLAKDITQQVFLKIFYKVSEFRGEAEFTTWLYRITINACLDEQRKTRRFFSLENLFGFNEPQTNRTSDDRILKKEVAAEVQAAIAELKPKFRLPILLKYVEGLSYEEIAGILDCSIGTVSSRLNRGHKMLAGKLKHLKDNI
jgi:RNA polymerase sigma-70 factor (ECF subfamily)